jgi:hypothetical protein
VARPRLLHASLVPFHSAGRIYWGRFSLFRDGPHMPSKTPCLLSVLFLTAAASAQNIPRSSHVWIITEENHSYEYVVGSSQMPYYNQLIAQYGLATQFYSDQHSSLPALMWFVAGAPIETDNDTVSCKHDDDNILRELLRRGYRWRSYQENMPYAGFQGLYGGEHNTYFRRHNPLIDFSDACPGTGQDTNSVPYSQMATDFADGETVNYAYITPNVAEDAHNGSLEAADQWLQANVPSILARPEFSPGGDGILFIVWDEGSPHIDNRCSATVRQGCGGRTATLVIGPRVKPGYRSTVTYHNENILATVCAAMGLSTCPGGAQNADPMADFFNTGMGADLFLRIWPSTTTVHQGDLLTYAFPVWNLGPANAAFEVLNTQVPAGTTFDHIRISGTPGLGTCATPPYGGTGQIVCHENSAMAPNTTWTVRLTVKVRAPSGTVITKSAATMADTPDPNLANNMATVSIKVQ